MLPWLIAGWILFGQKRQAGAPQSSTSSPPAAPPSGFLFRLPNDGYETTRLALALDGKPATQVGIFTDPSEALKVVASKGWNVPPDVRQLDALP